MRNLTSIEKELSMLRILQEKERLSHGEWREAICKEKDNRRDAIVSRRMFEEYRRRMLRDKTVRKMRVDNKVYYSINPIDTLLPDWFEDKIKDSDKVLAEKLEDLKEILGSLSRAQQANVIANYIKLLGLARTRTTLWDIMFPEKEIRKHERHSKITTKDIFNKIAEMSAKDETSRNPNLSFEKVKQDNLDYLRYINQPRFEQDIMAFDRMVKTLLERNNKSKKVV